MAAPRPGILALILVLVGIAGTVLPGVPGPILVFAGIVVAAGARTPGPISVKPGTARTRTHFAGLG
jgi:hypothetical protein